MDAQKTDKKLSIEQAEHKKDIDRCMSMLVEAGAKWRQGSQVSQICESQNPSRVDRSSQQILDALSRKDLAPQNLFSVHQLPEGDCKILALEYTDLSREIFEQDPSPDRDAKS